MPQETNHVGQGYSSYGPGSLMFRLGSPKQTWLIGLLLHGASMGVVVNDKQSPAITGLYRYKLYANKCHHAGWGRGIPNMHDDNLLQTTNRQS